MNVRSAVVSTTALVLLASAGAAQGLAGTNTVDSGDIIDGTIVHADVKANSLGGSRFMDNSVTSGKILDGTIGETDLIQAVRDKLNSAGGAIADGSVTTPKLADNAVTGAKIANSTVTRTDLANNAVFGENVAGNTLTGDDIDESTLAIPKVYKAQVRADGQLRFGSTGVTSQLVKTNMISTPGRYHVHFPVNVSQCAATGSSAGYTGSTVGESVIVATEVTDTDKNHGDVIAPVSPIQTPNDVWVTTYNAASSSGTLVMQAFALTVVC